MVITDPKGEIYKNHSNKLRSKGYNIIVLNFRNPNLGNAWNPLTLPYRLYKEGNIDIVPLRDMNNICNFRVIEDDDDKTLTKKINNISLNSILKQD